MERTTGTHYATSVAGRKRQEPGNFPAELKALREQLELSQFDACILLNVRPQTLSRYERGVTVPHPAQQTGMLDILRAELKKRARRKPSPE